MLRRLEKSGFQSRTLLCDTGSCVAIRRTPH